MRLVLGLMIFLGCLSSGEAVASKPSPRENHFYRRGTAYLEEAERARNFQSTRIYSLNEYEFQLAEERRTNELIRQYNERAKSMFDNYHIEKSAREGADSRAAFETGMAKAVEADRAHYARHVHVTVFLTEEMADANVIFNGKILPGKGTRREIQFPGVSGKFYSAAVAIEILRNGSRLTSATKVAKDLAVGKAATNVAFTEIDFGEDKTSKSGQPISFPTTLARKFGGG